MRDGEVPPEQMGAYSEGTYGAEPYQGNAVESIGWGLVGGGSVAVILGIVLVWFGQRMKGAGVKARQRGPRV